MKRMLTNIRMGLALPIALLAVSITWGEKVSYIDRYGLVTSSTCDLLKQNTDGVGCPSSSCYLVQGEISSGSITCSNNFNIVLADGAKLSVNGGIDAGSNELRIYGQIFQTGVLEVANSNGVGIKASKIEIDGGLVSVKATQQAIWGLLDVVFSGGSAEAKCYGSNDESTCGSIGTNSDGRISIYWVDSLYAKTYNTTKMMVCPKFKDRNGNTTYGNTKKDNGSNDAVSGEYVTGFNSTLKEKVIFPNNVVLIVDYNIDGIEHRYRAFINGEYTGSTVVEAFEFKQVGAISFARAFTPNQPATVVLPFTLTGNSTVNADFYRLKSVEQNHCSWMAKVKKMKSLPKADTPYVIKPRANKLIFTIDPTNKPEITSSGNGSVKVSGDKWIFNGVYSYKTWENDGRRNLAYAWNAADGNFGKVTDVTWATPFRAYLEKASASVMLDPTKCTCAQHPALAKSVSEISGIPEVIDVKFIDEDENGEYTTSMGRMNTRTGEFEMLQDYDLKGRKLNGAPKARGAYYGKKVLKK